MKSEITSVDQLLAQIFARRNWRQRLDLHQVFQLWDEVVGEEVAIRAQPVRLRGSVLWVAVSDSIWMQQLHLQKMLLMERLNGRLPNGGITDLRFQLDISINGRPRKMAEEKTPAQRTVNPEEAAAFEQHLEPLADEELKRAIRRVWRRFRQSGRP